MARTMKPPAPDAPLLQRRVYERLVALGIGPTKVPGFEKNFIPDLFRSTRAKKQLLGDNLRRLAKALQCTPEYLTDEAVSSPDPSITDFTSRALASLQKIEDPRDQQLVLEMIDRLREKEVPKAS